MDGRYVGHRAVLDTTNNQRVSGFIQEINPQKKRITLQGVKDEKTGKVLNGLHHFFVSEIRDVEIQPERKESLRSKSQDPTSDSERRGGKRIQYHKDIPQHLQKLKDLNHDRLLLGSQVNGASGDGESDAEDYSLPRDCTLIDDCTSDLFRNAIHYLKQQSVLGVSFEGVRVGRFGKLCWILMSARDHTMFFDILTMGKACMEAGIKEILESPDILKVIHDCRQPSDIMHHQYGVQLRNIFDTQVAVVMVYRLEHGSDCLPRYVSGLGECLQNHLFLLPEDIHIMLVRQKLAEKDEKVWEQRPAPRQVLDAAYKHVVHLRQLRLALMEKMQMDFILGVDIYLKKVRDAHDKQAVKLQEKQHMLPQDFVQLSSMLQATFREYASRRPRTPLKYVAGPQKDEHGLQENCEGVFHPSVIASHDTIWHGNNKNLFSKPKSAQESPSNSGSKSASHPTAAKTSQKGVSPAAKNTSDSKKAAFVDASDSGVTDAGSRFSDSDAKASLSNTKTSGSGVKFFHSTGVPVSAVEDQSDPAETKSKYSSRKEGEFFSGSDSEEKSGCDVLRKFMELHVENGESETDSLAARFKVRPAGSEMISEDHGKKKAKKKAAVLANADPWSNDLAAESKLSPRYEEQHAGTADVDSFDLIPPKSHLVSKSDASNLHTNTLMKTVEDQGPANSGFKLHSFSEEYRAPDPSLEAAKDALADILPSVPNVALTTEGTRAWTRNQKVESTGTSFSKPTNINSLQQLIDFNTRNRISSSKAVSTSEETKVVSKHTVDSGGETEAKASPDPKLLIPDLEPAQPSASENPGRASRAWMTQSLFQSLGYKESPQERLMRATSGCS